MMAGSSDTLSPLHYPQAVYQGNSVFVWLLTGFGKSICYQALPFRDRIQEREMW